MTKKRVLVLMNDYHEPPNNIKEHEIDRDNADWIIPYDVITNLRKLDYEVYSLAVSDNINHLKDSIESFKPHIVFNLLVEFAGESIFDQNVMSYLELLNVPFTGCSPRGLVLARNKAIAKKLLCYHDIKTPDFWVFPKTHPPTKPLDLCFPVIVKCVSEDASLGISQLSLVHNEQRLIERVTYLHEHLCSDAIAEKFIEGREFSIGVMGNKQLTTFPTWELIFANSSSPEQEFYHSYAKWNNEYRKRKGIRSQRAELDAKTDEKLTVIAKKVYRALNLNGYARIDFRMSSFGDMYVIEANPNPDICLSEDFSMSAKALGIDYPSLLKRIVSLGLNRQ